jgi:hypothetical protein
MSLLVTHNVTLLRDFGAVQHGHRAAIPMLDQLLDHLVGDELCRTLVIL